MNHDHFSRLIPAYFDGTLRESQRAEFEAYVGTNPDFAELFRKKQAEQQTLTLRIPDPAISAETTERLESEIREAIAHLFVEAQAPVTKRLTAWFRERI